jgi:hypothetical protein
MARMVRIHDYGDPSVLKIEDMRVNANERKRNRSSGKSL